MTFDEALDRIYLSDDRFYRVIDVAIRRIFSDRIEVFVRVSGHPPGQFSQTWDPAGSGPFKQMLAEPIEDHRVRAS
jgi:hypothetical protein